MAGLIETETYSLDASGWALAEAAENIVLTPADIDAALIVSSFTKTAGVIEDAELAAMSQRASPADATRVPVRCGDFHGFRAEYNEKGTTHWRVYWLARRNTHLYITYNCHIDYAGRHDGALDGIMGTLRAPAV